MTRAIDAQKSADRQLAQLFLRKEKLLNEQASPEAHFEDQLNELKMQLEDAKAITQEAQFEQDELSEIKPELAANMETAQQLALEDRQRFLSLEAKQQTLEQVQHQSLNEGQIVAWLEKHQMAERTQLWKKIQIKTGWEKAIEVVFEERLSAVELSRLDWVQNFIDDMPQAKLAFYAKLQTAVSQTDTSQTDVLTINRSEQGLVSMTELVNAQDEVLNRILPIWLQGIYVVKDLKEALSKRQHLGLNETIVTQDGHRITPSVIRTYAQVDTRSGILARDQEIQQLTQEIRTQEMLCAQSQTKFEAFQTQWEDLIERDRRSRDHLKSNTQKQHELQMSVQKLSLQSQQREMREAQIHEEVQEIAVQEEQLNIQKYEALSMFDENQAKIDDQQMNVEQGQVFLDRLERELNERKTASHQAQMSLKEAQFTQRSLMQKTEDNQYNQTSCHQQIELMAQQLEDLVIQQQELQDQHNTVELDEALERRVASEENLALARMQLDELTFEMRALDDVRLRFEKSLEPLRERITQFQMEEQASRLNKEQFQQQLQDAQVNIHALREQLALSMLDDVKASSLQGEITRLNNQIQSLGAVNMAALDELNLSLERQHFLTSQLDDLQSAIQTLEEAIRAIDKESRELLMSTYNEVNRNFGELFPELFGGGEAKLIMTGEEILDAGLQVMAQPPGKKNSSIHLLSGGEKALTATALVFALFKLNPAPFCLLDEVDAPLDDANTERFSQLVKKMSAQTQFLFISHNKITMEIAHQLVGVTMQEKGVSRVVAVDMHSALEMAGQI